MNRPSLLASEWARITLANLLIFLLALAIVGTGLVVRFLYEGDGEDHHGGHEAEELALERVEAQDHLRVAQDAELDWSEVSLRVAACTQAASSSTVIRMGAADPYVGDNATMNGAALNQPSPAGTGCGAAKPTLAASQVGTLVEAGQTLAFCASPSTLKAPARNVTVEVWHQRDDERIASFTFSDVSVCRA